MALAYSKESNLASVTQVLAPYSGYDSIPPWKLEQAAERGTIVHAHLAALATGGWMPQPKEEYRGYVGSGRLWLDTFMDEAVLVEEELQDPELGYCGHPDLVIRTVKLGGVVMIDWKTPAGLHRKIWGAQLAAYERLVLKCKGIKVDRIGSLRLHPDGRMAKFDEFTGSRVAFWAAFFGALVAFNFFDSQASFETHSVNARPQCP